MKGLLGNTGKPLPFERNDMSSCKASLNGQVLQVLC